MSPVGLKVVVMLIVLLGKSKAASVIGTFASIATRKKPVCHLVVRLRVPSGVMAMLSRSDALKRSTNCEVSELPGSWLTATPPMERNIGPRGQKNQNFFIRNPAFRPTAVYASSARMKSQLVVCGATHITDFG